MYNYLCAIINSQLSIHSYQDEMNEVHY